MSVRRIQGRFMAHSATEAYQRQLAAPAHKWKKAWVTPTGLGPESSYKICKWVRVPKEEDDGDDGFTQALDGDDDEEIDEGEDGTPAETPAAQTPDVDSPVPPLATSTAPAAPSALSAPPLTAEAAESEVPTPAAEAPAETDTPTEEPEPVHTAPTNAIEVSNEAPGHTEEGTGDLGVGGVVVETVTETESSNAAEVKTDGDVEMAEVAETTVAEETVPKADEGLIMGELEPPQPELAVEGSDAAPPEVQTPAQ